MGSRPNHLAEPRLTLHLPGATSFSDDIAGFGRAVPPRGPDRSKPQQEDFCLRRFLVAMQVSGRLQFPLTIEGATDRDTPDFWIATETGGFGIEVTQAGSSNWQQWLSESAKRGDDAELLPSDGYAGNGPERIVVADFVNAMRRKTQSYGGLHPCDLLIYENSEGGIMADKARVLDLLLHEKAAQRLDPSPFRAVHAIFGDTVILDLFGNARVAVDVSKQHAEDWVGWLNDQARHAKSGNLAALDLPHLAEELEALGRSDWRALRSSLRNLLVHLLKWQLQPKKRSRSWAVSVTKSRNEAEELVEENPSFAGRLPEALEQEYPRARREAARQMELNLAAVPEASPFTIDQLLDHGFMPEEHHE